MGNFGLMLSWLIGEHFIWFLIACAVIAGVLSLVALAVDYGIECLSGWLYARRERRKYREGRWS